MSILASKYALAYRMRKSLVFVAAALLIALAVTEWTHSTRLARNAAATDGVRGAEFMGRGGQFEMPPLW
jgi:hypothetical protein